MADPVSLAASIIALATAAAQISKAVSRLRAFGEVPAQVYALKNEVSDLEVVLRQVGYALEQKTLAAEAEQGSLEPILARTKGHLTTLAQALERFAEQVSGNKKFFSRPGLRWKGKEIFQRHQDNLRDVKSALNLIVGASNSRDLHHIKLELRQVAVVTSSQMYASGHTFNQVLESHRLALTSRMDEQYQGLNNRLDVLGQIFLNERLQNRSQNDAPPAYAEHTADQLAAVETVRVVMSSRNPCRNWCPCACHVRRKLNVTVPGVMANILGKMFVGYAGLPVLNKPCDFRGCRDRQEPDAMMEYWFPGWFVAMNLKMHLKLLPMSGPQFQLATTRRIPDSSQSITFAMKGDIQGLRHLFTQGLAHPRDISDSRGYSLLRASLPSTLWALYGGMHQYETVKFLISQGAPVDENSYENVWDFLFRGKCNETEARELRCITESGHGDWVEDQNFPLVHRIVFGISSKSLATELEENPHAVYLLDGQGRTALDWATARIQLEDMVLLIRQGSDPNNMDITGRTPVLHAVDAHNVDALRLILEAGGNPNPVMPKGVFRSSPLTAAGFAGMPDMLRLLLKFGGDPTACNPEGLTALHSVARTQNVECAVLLLDYGADLNAASKNGGTPLTTAIIHNNHSVLHVFVEQYYEFITAVRLKGLQLLPIIAEYADIETMNILASSHPVKLSYDLSLKSLSASREILEKRRDHDEKLAKAFEELTTIAQAEVSLAGSVESLQESGLFFSARSSFHSDLAEAMAQLKFVSSSTGSSSEEFDAYEDSKEKFSPVSPVPDGGKF
ncbi:ankyrin [Lojkania enalia]|uniref:Ankyrin n=1 Tax=Lojkania enalia TaxID=147567 RepID=A0A9P4K3W8_9PLEO|nr:ankyrin [Didymosphaeria enalia]